MKYSLIIFLILSPIIGIGQTDSETVYKNDIAIIYGAELNHFSGKTPGLEYRRSLNKNWKMKLSVFGERGASRSEYVKTYEFPLSDTSVMRRRQLNSYKVGRTIKIGTDYTGFKNFSIGAQFIFGKGSGSTYAMDQAFYDGNDIEYDREYTYSEELTAGYHPPTIQPAAGVIEYGYRTEGIGVVSYLTYGIGLTAEAKWPIGKHFEAALQYSPEFLYLDPTDFYDFFEKDEFYTTEFEGITAFYQYANIFLRFKF
jgi:hypothetical protein